MQKEFKGFQTDENSEKCCSNLSIYEIIYNLGTKWLVCNTCLNLEEFSSDIKEKVRMGIE